jgi:hypothetical protein
MTAHMTNRLAIVLGLLIVGFFVLDAVVLHLDAPIWIMRRLEDMIRQMAFWR